MLTEAEYWVCIALIFACIALVIALIRFIQ